MWLTHKGTGANGAATTRPWVLWLLISLSLTLIPTCLRPSFFMEPDDYLIAYILNGSYGDAFSAHCVYVQYPLGVLLSSLSAALGGLNCFFLLQMTMLCSSFFVLYLCLDSYGHTWRLIAAITIANVLLARMYLTYTVVAFCSFSSGIIGICTYCEKRLKSLPFLILCATNIVFGYYLRIDVALPMVCIALPFIFRAASLKVQRGVSGRELAVIAILLTSMLGGRAAHLCTYSAGGWEEYQHYNAARSHALDFPLASYDQCEDQLEGIGLSHVEYDLLRTWQFAQLDVFDKAKLMQVGELSRTTKGVYERLETGISALSRDWPFLAAGVILGAACIAQAQSRKQRLALWAQLVFLIVTVGYLAFIRLRLTPRVTVPIVYAHVFFCLLQTSWHSSDEVVSHRRQTLVLAATIAVGVLFCVGTPLQRNVERAQAFENVRHIREAIHENPETLYVCESSVANQLYFYGRACQDVRPTDEMENVVKSGSWDSFSPRYYAQLARFDTDPNKLLSSTTASGTRYVGSDDARIRSFIEEYTGRTCKGTIELEHEACSIYRLVLH